MCIHVSCNVIAQVCMLESTHTCGLEDRGVFSRDVRVAGLCVYLWAPECAHVCRGVFSG